MKEGCFREPTGGGDRSGGGPLERSSEQDQDSADEDGLLCTACGALITADAHRVEVDGSHESIRVNLYGVLFRIGCFSKAPGCHATGPASGEWTWFPGTTWQIVQCGRCGQHMGWLYRGEQTRFFGLLLDNLRRAAT